MEKQYVKLFEQLDQEGQFDSRDSKETEELSPAKRAALARGDDILSRSQYAACYINAKERVARKEDTRGAGDNVQTRTALNMTDDGSEDWRKVSGAKLSVYLNLKPQTIERNISKFAMMLAGNMDGTDSNVLYPEIIDYFKEFEAMHISDVLSLAEETIDKEADDTIYQKYLDKQRDSGIKTREKKKANFHELSKKVRSVFLNLYDKTRDMDQAARMTASSISKEYDTDKKTIATIAMRELKNEPTLQKAWRKIK